MTAKGLNELASVSPIWKREAKETAQTQTSPSRVLDRCWVASVTELTLGALGAWEPGWPGLACFLQGVLHFLSMGVGALEAPGESCFHAHQSGDPELGREVGNPGGLL